MSLLMADAIRVRLQEWADNPLEFDHVPRWLQDACKEERVSPYFGSEDYWYLDVLTPTGVQRIGPGDWIIYHQGTLLTAKFNGEKRA